MYQGEDLNFNLNDWIKVKLSQEGIAELKKQHKERNDLHVEAGNEPLPELKIDIDDEGYTKFQMWDFMSKLGHLFHHGSNHLPCEAQMRLVGRGHPRGR